MMDDGRMQPLRESQEGSFFVTTSRFLEQKGYVHYEISSFSRNRSCFSQHNQKYWHHTPYLGLGPSAHSFSGSRRWWNVRSIKAYCEALERGRSPVEDSEDLSPEELRFESIFLGLRTSNGFARSSLSQQPEKALPRLLESGYLTLQRERIVPTRKGFMVADYLACCLGNG